METPSKEELLLFAQRGMSYPQVASHYGVSSRKVDRWISTLDIAEEYKKTKKAFLHPPIDKSGTCESCREFHDGSYGSGRFCGEKCARSFATTNLTPEQKALRNQALQRGKITQNAAWAEWREKSRTNDLTISRPARKGTREWSQEQRDEISQRQKELWRTPEYKAKMANRPKRIVSDKTKKKLSTASKRLMEEGIISPWTTRGRGMRSYPEITWERELDNAGIEYEVEHLVKKRELDKNLVGHYFLDFLIIKNEIRLDLEIDGKQHLLEERMRSDAVRDELLMSDGYVVYRIPWVNPRHNGDIFRDQLSEFLDFYKNL